MNTDRVFKYIDQNIDTHIRKVQELIQQPSISSENLGVRDCAELVCRYFGELGCQRAELVETSGYPVVLGEYNANADKTVLVYMMYDTQPVDDPGWTVPPLEARLVDVKPFKRCIVARGAYNSKGPMRAFLNACEAIRAVSEEFPVNLLLVAEGEEELGSRHLPEFLKKEKKTIKNADCAFFPDVEQDQNGKITTFLGVKGIVYFELEVDGNSWGYGPTMFDIHGSNKAWIDSPTWRLINALSTMTTPDGNHVLIDGLYDNVAPITSEDQELLDKLNQTFDEKATKSLMKVDRFIDDLHGREALIKYMFEPSLNINGIWSGYTGPGSKTVLPWKATAKVDVRLIPNMKVDDVLPIIRQHLDAHGFKEIRIVNLEEGYGWAKMSPKHPVVQAILQTYQDFGHEPEIWPSSAGSLPFSMLAQNPFNLPFAIGGLGHGAGAHAPNEYIVIDEGGPTAGLATLEKSFIVILNRLSQI
ncbi:MAG: M20/M25/M40 family metallo-hydrolase [Promethearchaeota archaeon]